MPAVTNLEVSKQEETENLQRYAYLGSLSSRDLKARGSDLALCVNVGHRL